MWERCYVDVDDDGDDATAEAIDFDDEGPLILLGVLRTHLCNPTSTAPGPLICRSISPYLACHAPA